MKKIAVINGVNLNMLGIREKNIYGNQTYDGLCEYISQKCGKIAQLDFFQSNHEGDIIDKLQKCYFDGYDGIVLNPGAHTHYSYALYDAIKSISPLAVIEVHISDIHSREEFRRTSVTAPACVAQISGKGFDGYIEAVEMLAAK
ncbi:MAG: 3-dehydroquinate dehydratase [Clostridia bacterium]|nr:3-dehydroquinate dehydratase [Clostridia bacterium]MDE7328378.1 3-dehydroquinate dehydratase [Clostridia bacterium]